MSLVSITTVEQLRDYLVQAMRLEHATIPPYLTALYSIKPGTNADASHVLRVTVVEEMLHLTLAANLLNAVGGAPDLTAPGFVPPYPAYLPDGEDDFQVCRRPFSREAIETFLSIERPQQAPEPGARVQQRRLPRATVLAHVPHAPELQFYSIGEFYHEIWLGIERLHRQHGDDLFAGDPARQVGPEYFYSGGGQVTKVTDLRTAKTAIDMIAEQGEGFGGSIHDTEHELAHYYRFQQLTLGRYYLEGDSPGTPTGPPVAVDWDAAFPLKVDASLADYPEGTELHQAGVEFNDAYTAFLDLLTRAFTGRPELLLDAVVDMFRLRDLMTRLMRNPLPDGSGLNAAPTFEVTPLPVAVG